jgi:6-pyruvoyl-tetrahydropterin synthase
MKTKTLVWITTQFEAIHCWPEAPEEFFFLRFPHRHLFHVKVTIATSKDREVEFFFLKRKVDSLINTVKAEWSKQWSCESMATRIGSYLITLGFKLTEVEVSEDEENGAKVLFEESGHDC